jgi:hypothetical protein
MKNVTASLNGDISMALVDLPAGAARALRAAARGGDLPGESTNGYKT